MLRLFYNVLFKSDYDYSPYEFNVTDQAQSHFATIFGNLVER